MQTEYKGVDIDEFRWRPYPKMTDEINQAKGFSREDMGTMTVEGRKKRNQVMYYYTGKLIDHRFHNWANYLFLVTIKKKFEKEKNTSGIQHCDFLLKGHEDKERGADSLSSNAAFQGLAYIK